MVFELLNSELQKIVKNRFKEPTLPQKLAIPPIIQGKNVLLIAQTGTGKTEAVMLPIIHLILENKSEPIAALYVTPLKSLNRDLLDRLVWWCNQIALEISVRHGDTSAYERKLQLEFPPHILVVTLETLQPILTAKKFREHLKNIRWVIIDECLPYNTMITLGDGSYKKIGDIVEDNLSDNQYEGNCKKDIFVKSFNAGEIVDSRILKVHKVPIHTGMVHIRTKFYNIELSMTSNHPILVLRNKKLRWVNASDLRVSDMVVVSNQTNIDIILSKNNEKQDDKKRFPIIDENHFKKIYLKLFSSNNKNNGGQLKKLEETIKKLEEKGILPLYSNNERLPTLSRIVGHIFGDGWLTITKNTVATGFSASPYDLEEIKNDLFQFGFKLGSTSTRETLSTINSIEHGIQNVRGITNQLSNGSKSLAAFLVALEVPYGNKTNKVYGIPSWILNGSIDVKKEFLAAFIGSEMSLPSGRRYLDFDAPRISMNKRNDLVDGSLKLIKDFKKIFNEFGVNFSNISIKDGNLRKDSTQTKKFIITISNEEKNLLNLFRISVNYNYLKNEFFHLIQEYILAKNFARLNKDKLVKKIKSLRRNGYKDAEIGRMLGFDKELNSKGIPYKNYCSDVVRRILRPTRKLLIGFPNFNEWTKLKTQDCLLDKIAAIKTDNDKPEFVYDLTIDRIHNLFANDIVVHNCHETVDSKRGTQLAVGLQRLKELCQRDFQIIMLSATVGEPEKVARFFSEGKDVEIIKAVTTKQMDIQVISSKSKLEDKKIANKIFSSIETAARLRSIMDLIKQHRSVLAFTNTREFAEILASRIKTIDKKFPAEVHHSSLSKEVRIKTEKEFKQEKIKAIICTSSLQLGIDIGSVDLVLQYMSPRQVSQLIQRVGRSGHELERVSKGIVITTDEDDIFESAIIARKALNEELEEPRLHENSLDVLAHQLVGLTFDIGTVDLQRAYEIIRKSYPYKSINYTEFLEVCKQLQNLGLIFLNGYIKKRMRGFEYYFSQLSTIPSLKQYRIFNTLENSFVGVLDEEFVALHGEPNTTFIVKGEAWRIVDVTEDKVLVEPTVDIEAAIPAWEGELIPVSYEVAQEVGKLRKIISEKIQIESERELISHLQENYHVDENCAKKMIATIKKQLKYGVIPDDKTILVEDYENLVILHTCFGSLVNETLGRLITTMLTNRVGSVGLKTDPYRIMIQFQVKNTELIKDILFNTNPEHVRTYLEVGLTKSNLFEWKFVHVAKRFGAIARDAEYGKVRMKKIIEDYVGTPIYKETLRELETEKLDIEKTIEILRKIQNKEIKIIFKSGLSPLGRVGLKYKFGELVGPEKPEKEIFELFKKRLLNTQVRLICVNCGDWSQTFTVKEIPEKIKCKKCEARLLAITKSRNPEIIKLIKKGLRNLPITALESKYFERIKKTADLFMVYGKKACICLAGRGIGPDTTIRILAKYHKTDEDLFRDILEAERQYIKTKKYWKI